MYKVLKEKGNNVNITLENMETKASVVLGRISMPILDILKSAGHTFDGTELTMKDEWNLEVNEEIGKELAKQAMRMSKPIRDQRKTVRVEEPKKDNKQIDAMDVLLGLAKYN